jgi:hypothetical protein
MTKEEKALELVKRITTECSDFMIDEGDGIGLPQCFFCGEDTYSPHKQDCIWVEANKLIDAP